MKFSIKDFFSKHDQIRRFLRIWSHLQKKSLILSGELHFFCSVKREYQKFMELQSGAYLKRTFDQSCKKIKESLFYRGLADKF